MKTSSPAVALPWSDMSIRLLHRNRDPFRDGRELDAHPSFLLIVSLFDDGAAQIREVPPQRHMGEIVLVVVDPAEPRKRRYPVEDRLLVRVFAHFRGGDERNGAEVRVTADPMEIIKC